MSDLSPWAQAIVDAARADDASPGQSKSRIKRRILARVATAALAGTAATTASRTAASLATGNAAAGAVTTAAGAATVAGSAVTVAGSAATVAGGAATVAGSAGTTVAAKLIVGAAISALVASATATGVVVSRELAAPVPSAVQIATATRGVQAPPRKAPATTTLAETEAPTPVALASAGPAASPVLALGASPHAAAPKETFRESRTETLEQELPLLQAAQRALRAGDPEQALALLDSHAKRFPNGVLAEERRAVHAMASCRTNSGAARAEADEFLREAASSPLVERVREECTRRVTNDAVRGAGSR